MRDIYLEGALSCGQLEIPDKHLLSTVLQNVNVIEGRHCTRAGPHLAHPVSIGSSKLCSHHFMVDEAVALLKFVHS